MISENTLPESFQSLINLFETALKDTRFPGVDADILRAHQAEVATAEEAVAAAEEALAQARLVLREREQSALERGERALSYLRIFAADNETVAAAIAGLSLSRTPVVQAEAPKKRGRPRKTESEMLFTEPSSGGEDPLVA